MPDYAGTDYFMDLSLVDDPYPFFEYLRARGPVTRLPAHNVVAVTGFDEALSVYLDTDHFSAVTAVTGPLPPLPFEPRGDDITSQIAQFRPQIPFGEEELTLDPPRHTAMRSLMMRLFTPKRLREVESYLAGLSDRLLDEFVAGGRCELVSSYATPFALLAIADLLGMPAEDRAEFRKTLGAPPSQVGAASDVEVVNPFEYRKEKFLAYVEERRRAPRDDIMSEIANASFPDGSTPDAMDVVRIASLLFGAGQDTTALLLAACMRIVAEHPQVQARLRAEPALIPDFIEEVLRHSGPVKSSFRLVRRTTGLAGVPLPAGTHVMLAIAAFNRDPRRFDNPAEFRIGRPGIREHLAFGRGAHTCPGAALARTEVRISLERMLQRMADIAPDPEFHGPEGARRFRYAPTYVFRALSALHLRFTPS